MANVNKRPEKDCPTCGSHFVCIRPEQIFCSRECVRGKGRTHLICPCGASTGSYQKKYCCPEHHEKWRKHKTPTRMVTHTCLGCGEPFERPYTYPGKLKYCSNKCSHGQVKKVRDKFIADLPEGAVVFHSGWEIRFWATCLRFSIPIRSYDGPDIQTSQGVYRPDFIIEVDDRDIIIDVKGYLRKESEQKITDAIQQGTLVWTVDQKLLESLEEGEWEILLSLL